MAELYFLRHGPRADHDPDGQPLHSPYKVYDSSVTRQTAQLAAEVCDEIAARTAVSDAARKNVHVHFSPYLRCCETADLVVTHLRAALAQRHPSLQVKFSLLGDFALSEWIHDKMANQPPFYDSNEAYQMYTPNIQLMENRKCVSNFRPTTKLGPWNEPDLSFKEFQERCKEYFQKLLATYEAPAAANDLVIVVSHGYVISNLLSHFLSQPIFEEIPELGANYATKTDGVWSLKQDCLGILAKHPSFDSALNLASDIVYYKTNFIKKDELDEAREFPAIGFGGLRQKDSNRPRPSFRINSFRPAPTRPNPVPLCPAAKDWSPQNSNSFTVRSEFKQKVMNDEAFKKAFDLSKPPKHPLSPLVSPNSEPSRINSTVDLSKLASNEEIYHPLKLRYSSASDIPVQYLNSKVNSHASLHRLESNNSSTDFSRQPLHIFPPASSGGTGSPRDRSDTESALNMNEVITRLSRVRSLQRKRVQSTTPKFGKIAELDSPVDPDQQFHLQFRPDSPRDTPIQPAADPIHRSPDSTPSHTFQFQRPRRSSSMRFVPSLEKEKPGNSIFYHLNSGSSSSEDESETETSGKYMWFGENVGGK